MPDLKYFFIFILYFIISYSEFSDSLLCYSCAVSLAEAVMVGCCSLSLTCLSLLSQKNDFVKPKGQMNYDKLA